MGVDKILEAIVSRIPAPTGDPNAPLQALIFDSVFNSFRGIIVYYRIMQGSIKKGDIVKFVSTGQEYGADEVGILKLKMTEKPDCQGGFTMVDMCDNAKIPDVLHVRTVLIFRMRKGREKLLAASWKVVIYGTSRIKFKP